MPIFTHNRDDYPEEYTFKENELSKAIDEKPENANSWLARGNFYFEFGLFKQSASDFKEAIRLGIDDVDTHYYLANSYFLSEQYIESINEWSYLIGKNKEEAEFYSLHGWAYRKSGDYKLSEADYGKAISLTPDDEEHRGSINHYHYFRGQLYCEMREYSKAIHDFQFTLKRSPYWKACKMWLKDAKNALKNNLPFTEENFCGYEGHSGFVEMRPLKEIEDGN